MIPIQIANKAGVRFDPNQIVQEGFIGGLAREISSKGFTSSDIRKILINEGELQLSIAKIKEMVLENEEICKRDNAKAKDIVKNRTLTSKFYNELEKENEVDILKPDTTLIKSVIDNKKEEKVEKVENKPKQEVAKKTESAKKPQANKTKGATKKATASSSKGKGGGGGSSKPKKQEVKKDNKQANNSASTKKEQLFIYNSSVGSSSKNEQNAIKSQRVRESAVGNLDNKNQTFTDQRDVADELEL